MENVRQIKKERKKERKKEMTFPFVPKQIEKIHFQAIVFFKQLFTRKRLKNINNTFKAGQFL